MAVITLQAIPANKSGSLNNNTDWNVFKIKLIEEFGSIEIFGRDVNQIFALLPRFESVQEVAKRICLPRLRPYKPIWKSYNSSTMWKTSTASPSPRPSFRTS